MATSRSSRKGIISIWRVLTGESDEAEVDRIVENVFVDQVGTAVLDADID